MTAYNPNRTGGAAMVLLIIMILLGGCGASDSDQANDASTATTTSEVNTQSEATAQRTTSETDVSGAGVQATQTDAQMAKNYASRDAAPTATEGGSEPVADSESPPSGYHSSDRTAPRDDPSASPHGDGQSAMALTEALPIPELPDPTGRKPAPKSELVDIAGHRMTLDSFDGQAVLVVFWATWCPPCKAEIPHLVHLQDKYGEAGLKILGLSLDQGGLPDVKRFLKTKREINYTIIPNGQLAARAFGKVNSIPTTILLDKKGRILKRFVGLRPETELEGWVVAAMKENI